MALRNLLLILVFFLYAQLVIGQSISIPLYEGNIPNAKKVPEGFVEQTDADGRVTDVTTPVLIPFFPKKVTANGTAILIFPGGGYRLLSLDACKEIGRALSEEGITAFIVKYRLPNDTIMEDKSIGPLQDAQAAIRLVRKKAAQWGINPRRIGTMGLSAGGHVVSMEGTQQNRIVINNEDKINLRPDFMVLLYPVIIYDPAIPRTREKLIGKDPTPALLNLYSTDKHVTSATPPTFLVHAIDDDVIPVKNTLSFFNSLLTSGVKAQMLILQSGGHGFGISDLNSSDNWFRLLKSWIIENGF